jgi:hypothetical protein
MVRDFTYPQHGPLRALMRPGDFLDGQSVPLPAGAPDAIELTIATFFAMPGWVVALLGLRDTLVRPLGLRTGTPQDIRPPTRQEIIDCSFPGLFAVHASSPDEVILGADDRHLDFRISLLRSAADGVVALSTWVHPHNLGGRAYLAAVYPFHRVIVARCLANAARISPVNSPSAA